jgi:hypothetical protein
VLKYNNRERLYGCSSEEDTMKALIWLTIALLMCTMLIGCGATDGASPDTDKILAVEIGQAMGLNWDSDPDPDGIECYLAPRDLQGELIAAPGTASAQLWLSLSVVESSRKGDLVQEWSGIKVKAGDYDPTSGALIRLEYRNFTPDMIAYGILEVTLETADGKKFTAREDSVILGG